VLGKEIDDERAFVCPAARARRGRAGSVGHSAAACDKARAAIADLHRIVTPRGLQKTFKLRIGGIGQWIYVRGQDAGNPMLLLIHGCPASLRSAAMWEFQRPVEEYFTVVHWDQRGAGRTYLAFAIYRAIACCGACILQAGCLVREFGASNSVEERGKLLVSLTTDVRPLALSKRS
jgi:hypothetical protein